MAIKNIKENSPVAERWWKNYFPIRITLERLIERT
jgi:hypothetical protein